MNPKKPLNYETFREFVLCCAKTATEDGYRIRRGNYLAKWDNQGDVVHPDLYPLEQPTACALGAIAICGQIDVGARHAHDESLLEDIRLVTMRHACQTFDEDPEEIHWWLESLEWGFEEFEGDPEEANEQILLSIEYGEFDDLQGLWLGDDMDPNNPAPLVKHGHIQPDAFRVGEELHRLAMNTPRFTPQVEDEE